MSTDIGTVCTDILALTDATDMTKVTLLANRCAQNLEHVNVVLDTIDAAFAQAAATSSSPSLIADAEDGNNQRSARSRDAWLLALWFLVDKLCKQHTLFVDGMRPRLLGWGTKAAPTRHASGLGAAVVAEDWWTTFLLVLDSLKVFFGGALISLIKLKCDPSIILRLEQQQNGTGAAEGGSGALALAEIDTAAAQRALVQHSTQLRSIGGFMTKVSNSQRTGPQKAALQVRTVDSFMAMSMASAYAPARPVEIQTTVAARDSDAPLGFMQAVPESVQVEYAEQRKKRLREVLERNRLDDDRKSRERLLVGAGGDGSDRSHRAVAQGIDFLADVSMPEELPRDEYGVKRANYPRGVRFIRDAIRDCGGAVELDVIVQRISTLANKEVVAEFGDVREFLMIHQPTFRVHMEDGDVWVVRLAPSAYPSTQQPRKQSGVTAPLMSTSAPTTYAERHRPSTMAGDPCGGSMMTAAVDLVPRNVTLNTECPYCTLQLKSRNLARHMHCRRCVNTQIALGLDDSPILRGPISEMAYAAKWIISNRSSFDDQDLLWFAQCVDLAAAIPRYRLSSPKKFLPILKAIRVVRDAWLERKGVAAYPTASTAPLDFGDVSLDGGDVGVAEFFRIIGSNLFRLPVSWIETGDLIAMCKRFASGIKAAHIPPPRPADPRIHLHNDFPGMLLCESEIDSEDEPSDDEAEYSDDEGEGFQFAPPVSTVETLTTAGFERDTKKLNYKLKTAPPLVHSRVIRGDGSQTHSELYSAAASEKQKPLAVTQQQQQLALQAPQGTIVSASVVRGPQLSAGAAALFLSSADEAKRVVF